MTHEETRPATRSTELRQLPQLLLATPAQIQRCDVALLNLICAEGLPGADGLDADRCLTQLDTWAQHIKSETDRHLYRFQRNPAEFDNSEGYFRMLIMAVVVCEDFSVRYNPERISDPASPTQSDDFFADSRDLFLHGLLGHSRTGTCSSMPVLYVALGRRLGYPLKLVTTKAHLFARWDSPSERFNLEATGRGMNRYDDEHFKSWPFPVSDEEIRSHGYLKSLSPTEETALFLSLRGHCLRHAGRLQEALAAYSAAVKLAPGILAYQCLLADAQQICSLAFHKAPVPRAYVMPLPGVSSGGRIDINPGPNPLINVRPYSNTSTQ